MGEHTREQHASGAAAVAETPREAEPTNGKATAQPTVAYSITVYKDHKGKFFSRVATPGRSETAFTGTSKNAATAARAAAAVIERLI